MGTDKEGRKGRGWGKSFACVKINFWVRPWDLMVLNGSYQRRPTGIDFTENPRGCQFGLMMLMFNWLNV